MLKLIHTDKAPKAIGPYSQATCTAGEMLFISGQLGLNPQTMEMAGNDVESQARQVMQNVLAILQAADFQIGDIARATIYLTNMKDFQAVNAIYEAALQGHRPARACVEVSALPKGGIVEVDAIAVRSKK